MSNIYFNTHTKGDNQYLEPPPQFPYQCRDCGKQCKSVQGLISHERNIHWERYACPICEGGSGSACGSHFL